MKISGIQNVPIPERSHAAPQVRPQEAPASPTPAAEQPSMEEQLAKTVKNVGARIASAVDAGALTTRQAQALNEVQKDFGKQMGRLADAMHSEGFSRQELNDGMSKVYGNLRESLNAILSSGTKAQPFDALLGSALFDKSGFAVDVTV